uniref:Centromere protein X n=1 Tax=Nothoprocta perdicaria TaxID=30464 RepID=A0A8C6ZJU4_NOTPE
MEERDGRAGGFRKETVERLLRLHFRDGRTRGSGAAGRAAAARAARQAQGEELDTVDVEHVEKVLPQLVGRAGRATGCPLRQGPPGQSRPGLPGTGS